MGLKSCNIVIFLRADRLSYRDPGRFNFGPIPIYSETPLNPHLALSVYLDVPAVERKEEASGMDLDTD